MKELLSKALGIAIILAVGAFAYLASTGQVHADDLKVSDTAEQTVLEAPKISVEGIATEVDKVDSASKDDLSAAIAKALSDSTAESCVMNITTDSKVRLRAFGLASQAFGCLLTETYPLDKPVAEIDNPTVIAK